MAVSPGLLIRSIQPSDSEAIWHIIDGSRQLSEYPIGPEWTENHVAEECGFASGRVAISEDGAVLGFVLYRDMFEAFEISYLATAPAARSRGVMKALIGDLASQLPEGKGLWLEVHEQNVPARSLYERVGFRLVGRRPKYYADGGAACLYNYG